MKAEVYTMDGCVWCSRAKNILKMKNYEVQEHVLVRGTPETDAAKAKITAISGRPVTTLPQIFLDGEYIGGCQDLAAKLGVNIGC